jgi:hypothetical protein
MRNAHDHEQELGASFAPTKRSGSAAPHEGAAGGTCQQRAGIFSEAKKNLELRWGRGKFEV